MVVSGAFFGDKISPMSDSTNLTSSALGVSAAAYAPYAVLCWLTAVVVAIFGYANVTMTRLPPAESEPEDQQ